MTVAFLLFRKKSKGGFETRPYSDGNFSFVSEADGIRG
jgi:hypothetical protein